MQNGISREDAKPRRGSCLFSQSPKRERRVDIRIELIAAMFRS